ncbi:phosphoglycerate transport regulatory protein PgtC [Klebsiella pneumoniae]|uniref:Phosphoglycerate transport regulatory protein PgtC n=1 Tax=Klebsiella pneumoniae TaxID=573 RepID=A0A2X3EV35_KLEPN|nr:phosphoglycerate transport regulatory protein PgtC [Klebsiella pneumoniae]
MNGITNIFLRGGRIVSKMLALLLLTAWLRPCAAQGNELVMATTFSPSATVWIIDRWQQEPGSVMIRTLNRTSASLEQLLDTANAENVDLILTSSPMLLQHLQEHQKLAPFSGAPAVSQHLVPESIRSTSVAVAISGFGLLMNRSALMTRHLPAPADWDDLTDPRYQGALLMSSPSRSDTNHLMVESLLQQKGWIKGWETLLTTAGNLVTISSRSFGVADKIKSGLGVAGPVIDNYANLLLNDPHLAFTYFPQSAVSPTYVAVLKNSQHASEARRFIRYLLSPEGQTILADANTGKYPVTPLAPGNPRAAQQAMLMNQPAIKLSIDPQTSAFGSADVLIRRLAFVLLSSKTPGERCIARRSVLSVRYPRYGRCSPVSRWIRPAARMKPGWLSSTTKVLRNSR